MFATEMVFLAGTTSLKQFAYLRNKTKNLNHQKLKGLNIMDDAKTEVKKAVENERKRVLGIMLAAPEGAIKRAVEVINAGTPFEDAIEEFFVGYKLNRRFMCGGPTDFALPDFETYRDYCIANSEGNGREWMREYNKKQAEERNERTEHQSRGRYGRRERF